MITNKPHISEVYNHNNFCLATDLPVVCSCVWPFFRCLLLLGTRLKEHLLPGICSCCGREQKPKPVVKFLRARWARGCWGIPSRCSWSCIISCLLPLRGTRADGNLWILEVAHVTVKVCCSNRFSELSLSQTVLPGVENKRRVCNMSMFDHGNQITTSQTVTASSK